MMTLCTMNFYSCCLNGAVTVNVLLPAPPSEQEAFPCLLLLHGMQGDAGSWLRFTRVEQYAAQYGLAVVLPSIGNSFGLDLPGHMHYDTFLCEELPSCLRRLLPLSGDPARNYIAGLSMGGFAALRIALRHPERFAGAASFSGALEPDWLYASQGETVGAAAGIPSGLLIRLAEKACRTGRSLPPLFLTCGTEDGTTLSMNRHTCASLSKSGIDLVYEEWSGGHDWDFWDESLKRALARFCSAF